MLLSSVRPSVRHIRPSHAAAAGLLLWARRRPEDIESAQLHDALLVTRRQVDWLQLVELARRERALRRLTDLGSGAELAEVGQLRTGGAQVVSHGHVTSQLVLGRRAQPVDHLQRHQPHARHQLSSRRRRRRRRETIETFKT